MKHSTRHLTLKQGARSPTRAARPSSPARDRLDELGIIRTKDWIYLGRDGNREVLCARFTVSGTATSTEGAPLGALCRAAKDGDTPRQIIIPFDALRDMRKLADSLLQLGIVAPLETRALKAIAAYIHAMSDRENVVVLEREGLEWIIAGDRQYPVAVIGSKLITPDEVNATVALRKRSIFSRSGNWEEWYEQSGTILPGNQIPIVVISAALSAPFKFLFDLPLMSLHVSARSASGRMTLGCFVNALFGPPHEPHGWSGTVNGLEALAVRHRDAPLVLDEMGEGNAADVLDAIYRLNNGMQKARAQVHGRGQETVDIRTVVIAFSEVTLADHVHAGRQALRRDHDARMPTIAAEEPYGCFSSLNGFPDAAALTAAMKRLGQRCSGVVWPRYVRGLIRHYAKCAAFVQRRRERYAMDIAGAHHDTLSALEGRVLAGCTTWALAGELAIRLKVLPLEKGAAVQHVFTEWLMLRWISHAYTPQEAVLLHVRDFFQRQAAGLFDSLADWETSQRRMLAGFVLDHDRHGRLFLVHRGFFGKELCRDVGVDAALAALDAAGLLVAHKGGRTWKQRMPGSPNVIRFYAIKDAIRFDD